MPEAETQTFVLCTFSPPAAVFLIAAVCVFLQNFLNSSSCPEIQGYLYLKEPGRKSWKKLYMFLRRSGLYYSTKGTSKVIDRCPVDSQSGVKESKCGGDGLVYIFQDSQTLCKEQYELLSLFAIAILQS